MAFMTSFLTGALQRKLDNWGQEDAQIADRIQKIGEQLVTADDNATEKVNKLGKVAGVLNSKYGQNGIYQLAYQVDNNAIDFNDDVDDIADRVAEFQIPEDYKASISNPYDYLGEQTQAMYDNDMAAYNALYSNVNVGNKTAEMLVPKKDYKASYAGLEEAPTIGAEPITSAYPGMEKKDYVNTAYNKLAFLVKNNIPISEANNPEVVPEQFRLDEMEMNLIKGDTAQADGPQEILEKILVEAATDKAKVDFLGDTPRDEIIQNITNILGIPNEQVTYSQSSVSQMQQDPNVTALINQGFNVAGNVNALSDYQKNLPKLNLNFDIMSDNEVNEALSGLQDGTLIEFISNGQTYFVEY